MTRAKPLALIVFLENVGHVHGIPLPRWAMQAIDFVTEEYAKLLLRVYGAYRRYDRVVVLEDARANGPELAATLTALAPTHQSDLLLLVHGRPGALVGHRGECNVGDETFAPLLKAVRVVEPTDKVVIVSNYTEALDLLQKVRCGALWGRGM